MNRLKTRRILWVNDSGEMLGGCEHYVRNTAQLLKEMGVSNYLLYGGQVAALSSEMLKPFDGAFPMGDVGRQVAEIDPSVVYLHRVRGIEVTRAFAQCGKPVMRFYHDHRLFCLREHKYKALTYRLCQKPIGLRCYPCIGFVGRTADNRLHFKRLGHLRAELAENLKLRMHVVGSQYMAGQLVQHGFPRDKVRVLPLYSLPPSDSAPVRRSPDLLLYTGQLTWGKGLDVLLRAVAQVKRPIRLVILGTGRQEPLFRRHCESLNLNGTVTFAGKATPEQLAEYYRQALCVIVPSRQPETFSLVGPEAMSHGTAVIASGIGGVGEWLEDGKTGLCVPPGDAEKLASAIDRIAGDIALADKLGQEGRRQYLEKFQPERHLEGLVALFESLV